jgi:hypothetical protein
MIDIQAVALVKETQAKLTKMKDARPSELLALKEQFGEAFLEILTKAAAGITVEQKVKLFDELLAAQVENIITEINERMENTYCEDSDHVHYTYEAVVTGTLGADIFKATNELETLLSRR